MPTHLSLDRHLEVLAAAGVVLGDQAQEAGLEADVPTCPDWTVRDLVSHQGMVHRWAAAHLRGETDHDTTVSRRDAATTRDLFAWYSQGLEALLEAAGSAPDDLEAMVFLRDAPPPRHFWTRRQAHETTIHGADAIAALLGRWPTADEVGVDPEVAADGIDELLSGFLSRGKGKLRFDEPVTLMVRTQDTGHAWTMHIDDGSNTVTVGESDSADVLAAGRAAELYLGLWNRGNEITMTGQADLLDRWRQLVRVSWS